MARLDKYTDEQRNDILTAMQKVKLETVEPIIFWGTLLGAVREQGFIKHDDDIDFAYISRFNKIKDVRNEMYEIYCELNDKGWLRKVFMHGGAVFELPPRSEFKGYGQCHFAVDGWYFDLFTLWFDEAGELHSCPYLNLGKDYLPLVEYKLYDRKFKSIKNARKFLTRVYGNWRIPSQRKSREREELVL